MAKRFTVIPQNLFNELQVDAGVLLKRFNPANPVPPADNDIICATTGGINSACVPTYSDLLEDVDNAPNNTKEGKHLDSWECTFGFTSIGISVASLKLSLGCADINNNAVIPRKDLEQTDFDDIWWVGDLANGGACAVHLINALSTSGFSLQTTKNGKGQNSVTLTGHTSINSQDTMPMEFYVLDAEETGEYNVVQNLDHVTSSYSSTTVDEGDSLEITLTADDTYTLSTVKVYMGGIEITSMAFDDGTVTIPVVTGNVLIVASATK